MIILPRRHLSKFAIAPLQGPCIRNWNWPGSSAQQFPALVKILPCITARYVLDHSLFGWIWLRAMHPWIEYETSTDWKVTLASAYRLLITITKFSDFEWPEAAHMNLPYVRLMRIVAKILVYSQLSYTWFELAYRYITETSLRETCSPDGQT